MRMKNREPLKSPRHERPCATGFQSPLRRVIRPGGSVLEALNAEAFQFLHGLWRQLCSCEVKLLQGFQRKQHRHSGIVQLAREPQPKFLEPGQARQPTESFGGDGLSCQIEPLQVDET